MSLISKYDFLKEQKKYDEEEKKPHVTTPVGNIWIDYYFKNNDHFFKVRITNF